VPRHAAERGVLIQQGAGLAVRQPDEAGVRADVAQADDLPRPWTTVGDPVNSADVLRHVTIAMANS